MSDKNIQIPAIYKSVEQQTGDESEYIQKHLILRILKFSLCFIAKAAFDTCQQNPIMANDSAMQIDSPPRPSALPTL